MVDQWEKIFLTTINSISVLVGCCANVLIIISFFFYTPMKEATERFLVSLSLADFLSCAISQSGLIIHINEVIAIELNSTLKIISISTVMMASLHGLLAVTVDRFVSIYLPFKYVYWMNDRNVRLIISVSWMWSFIVPILFSIEVLIVTNIVMAYRAVILLLIPFLYIIIYREAKKQARRIKESSPPMAGARPTNKATKGVGLVLATTVVSWLPITVLQVRRQVLSMAREDLQRHFIWCMSLACLNSCINPFLYYWQFSKFRRSIIKMIPSLGSRIGIAKRPPLQRGERPTLNAENDASHTRRTSAWRVVEVEPV